MQVSIFMFVGTLAQNGWQPLGYRNDVINSKLDPKVFRKEEGRNLLLMHW